MTPRDFREHCRNVAHWVDWDKTVDLFMHGDGGSEVHGIAVTWLATNAVLRQAAAMGANFVISHEGAFYPHYSGTPTGERHHAEKHRLMDQLGITLMRCHDTWDRMPGDGIPDAWAAFLAYPTEPRPVESFYRACLVGGQTLGDLAAELLAKMRPLGQQWLGVVGDRAVPVERLVVGTGAITRLGDMAELSPDAILATDDGLSTTASGLWSLDLGVPLLIVNHATAELPGMQALAGYIGRHFPGVPVHYLPCAFPYPALCDPAAWRSEVTSA
jgi:putative NIF3 family GTP cyclohydrolase 1 type 2